MQTGNQSQTKEDPHWLLTEASHFLDAVGNICGDQDETLQHLTGEQLFFLLLPVQERLNRAKYLIENESKET